MAINHLGAPVILTGGLTPLEPVDSATPHMRWLSIVNRSVNSTMQFGRNELVVTGELTAGMGYTFHDVRPCDVFVRGTSGDIIYWTGNG